MARAKREKQDETDAAATRRILEAIANAADDKKAVDLVALQVGGLTSLADYFVFCSGQSVRQTKTIADSIEQSLKQLGVKPHHVEGKATGHWILMDYGDIIVHIFMPETRDFFDLEGLWGDAQAVKLGSA